MSYQGTRTGNHEDALYYEKRWKSYLHHTHRRFIDRISTRASDIILDPSCGTGLLASELLEQNRPFRQLVLNDADGGMVSYARSRLPQKNDIAYRNQPAEDLTPANHFDVILCLNAFHYYQNQPEVIKRFRTLLKQGGRIYLLDWNREGLFRAVNSLIRWWVPEYIETRSKNEMNALLTEAGFTIKQQDSWKWRYWNFFFFEARLT